MRKLEAELRDTKDKNEELEEELDDKIIRLKDLDAQLSKSNSRNMQLEAEVAKLKQSFENMRNILKDGTGDADHTKDTRDTSGWESLEVEWETIKQERNSD